jgi:hypothetical protein
MQDVAEIGSLLQQVAEHLKSGKRPDVTAAAAKLNRIAAIATTLAFTIKAR